MNRAPRFLLPALLLLISGVFLGFGSKRGAATPTCPRESWAPKVSAMRTALLKNDANSVRDFLAWIATRADLPDLDARARALAEDPRIQPGQADPGDLIDLGAEALGDVGLACGACHARAGAGPSFAPLATPAMTESMSDHMGRHLWAMDRLWDGIIGPNDQRWVEGVGALHDHPIDAERLEGRDGGLSPSDYMDWWIHQPGPSVGLTATGAGRGRFYGQMLTACAACHAGTAGAPASPPTDRPPTP